MNKIILVTLAVVVLAAAGLSGMFTKPNQKQNYTPVSGTAACLDFDPPSTTETITYNGQTYGLIKKDAQIAEESKFKELTPLGNNMYSLGNNYFGQAVDQAIIFLLKTNTGKAPYIFDIYIKNSVPIPDYIKNCKGTGGQISVVQDPTNNTFPPSSFNKTDIQNLSDQTVSPGYVYDGNKTTSNSIKSLPEAKLIGSLRMATSIYSLYNHLNTLYLIDNADAYEYLPSDNPIPPPAKGKDSLQLKKVTFVTTSSYSWWTPVCKPAIYLYPQKTQMVSVKVDTKGFFTLTIPQYGSNGWFVKAEPTGKIQLGDKSFPYLYYESKVQDNLVEKPKNGYIVKKEELGDLFKKLLPELGLNEKESKEFSDYWIKALSQGPYYFVGVMSDQSINQIEPLSIDPIPDKIIRVRLYFEVLRDQGQITEPKIVTPKRTGFTVVEWGGMVKADKNSDFTCSQ